LIGNDHDLTFTYKYDSTAGGGADVYIIGMFLPLVIQPTNHYRIQQTLVSTSNILPSRDVPSGGRPLADTRTRMEMVTGLTVLEPLFLGHTVWPKPPKSSL